MMKEGDGTLTAILSQDKQSNGESMVMYLQSASINLGLNCCAEVVHPHWHSMKTGQMTILPVTLSHCN